MEEFENIHHHGLKGAIKSVGTFVGLLNDRKIEPTIPEYPENYDSLMFYDEKIYSQNKCIQSVYNEKGKLVSRTKLEEEKDDDPLGLRTHVWTINGAVANRNLIGTKYKDYVYEFIKDNISIWCEYAYFGHFEQCINNLKRDLIEYQIIHSNGEVEKSEPDPARYDKTYILEYLQYAECKIDIPNKIIYIHYYDIQYDYEYDEDIEEYVPIFDFDIDLDSETNSPGYYRRITLTYDSAGLLKKKVEEEFENVDRKFLDVETISYKPSLAYGDIVYKYDLEHLLVSIEGQGNIISLSNYDEFRNPKEIIFDNGENIFLVYNKYKYYGQKILNIDSAKLNDLKNTIISYDEEVDSSIIIPDCITRIEPNAFTYKVETNSIYIHDKVEQIGEFAFHSIHGLEEIKVDKNNKFYTSIDGILFNKDVTQLIYFPSYKRLNEYTIPDSVISIFDKAFRGSILDHVYIPENVKNIGKEAFADCRCLENIELPPFINKIDDGVFSGCSKLQFINVPACVKKIGNKAFYWCQKLEHIELPDSLEEIGSNAFAECEKLQRINIPNGIKEISSCAFSNCSKLDSINIGKDIQEIKFGTFMVCISLKELTIPASVTKIYRWAFYNCVGLTDFYVHADTPPKIEEGAFHNGWTDARRIIIHVPVGKEILYQEDEGWKSFRKIIGDIP